MARKRGLPVGELSRRENKKFNDLRNKVGVEGIRDKETRAIERWMKTNKA